MAKGKIITIEGGDGTGKQTQTVMLVKRLQLEGYSVETLSFPKYETPTGKIIRAYLDRKLGPLKNVPPKIASALYAADRLAAQQEIKGWISEGKIVVLDRYIESNMAFQSAKLSEAERKEMIEWVHDFEVKDLGILPSDLVVFLNLPLGAAQDAMENEGRTKDIHESNKPFSDEVRKTYSFLADFYGWKTVECMSSDRRLSVGEVSEKIWEIVKESL